MINIHLQVSQSDWLTTKKYWKELEKLFVKPDDRNKMEFVNHVIFESAGLNQTDKPNQENSAVSAITATPEIPSISTMNEILTEIDIEAAVGSPNSTTTNEPIDDKIKKFISEPVKQFEKLSQQKSNSHDGKSDSNSKYNYNFEYQLYVFGQFCAKVDIGDLYYTYKGPQLETSQFADENVCNKYKLSWNDFVSIRVKLFDNRLFYLLTKILNINKNEVNDFYNKCLRYYRTLCCTLPIDAHKYRFDNRWFSMIKTKAKTTDETIIARNDIYKFIVLWNGISKIFNITNLSYNVELVSKIEPIAFKQDIDPDLDEFEDRKNEDGSDSGSNGSNYSELINKVSLTTCEFICDQLAQTNIFGHYVNMGRNDKDEKILSKNKSAYNLCKKMLFNDNFDELHKLVKYCFNEHISDINNYKSHVPTMVALILNEFAYVVFHDLSISGLPLLKNEYQLLFPQLLPMFEFMYNTCCYIYCCPTFRQRDRESFFITQYFDLRHTLYKNIFNYETDNNDAKALCLKASKLNKYSYFGGSAGDGTLLHKACLNDHRQYFTILMKDGFDINEMNRRYGGLASSPYTLAQERKSEAILSIIASYNNKKNNNKGGNGDDENTANVENKNNIDSSELSTSNMQSIQDSCDLLLNQIMMAKYVLICLEIDNINDDFEVKSEKHKLTNGSVEKVMVREFMSDHFYVKLGELKDNLSVINSDQFGDKINGVNAINGIVSVIMKLMDIKMVISDDLMLLCWIYCNSISNNNSIKRQFLKSLLNCITDCLSGKSEYKLRNYMYFKQFLLHSNIWYCKDSENNKLLFNYVNDLADKLLISQKEYIRDSIEKEEKQDSENWYKLCNFNKYNNTDTQFRQDEILNGIKSVKSIENTYIIAAKINNPEYNVFAEFNDKIYLTQCITFANENNDFFQSQMKKLFANTKGKIKKAPVKTYDRCLVKSS